MIKWNGVTQRKIFLSFTFVKCFLIIIYTIMWSVSSSSCQTITNTVVWLHSVNWTRVSFPVPIFVLFVYFFKSYFSRTRLGCFLWQLRVYKDPGNLFRILVRNDNHILLYRVCRELALWFKCMQCIVYVIQKLGLQRTLGILCECQQ